MARDIEEHPTAGDAPPSYVLDAKLAAADDFVRLHAVVEAITRMEDVAEAVPLAGSLRPEVVEVVIAVDLAGDELHARSAAAEKRRIGLVDTQVQREDSSFADELCAGDDALWCEEVQAAELVVVAEEAPGGTLRGAGLDW